MFSRDAGHERGVDYVTHASDAMDRSHGIDCGPGGSGGFGRGSEHENAAESKQKTPDVDLGCNSPPRFRPQRPGRVRGWLPKDW